MCQMETQFENIDTELSEDEEIRLLEERLKFLKNKQKQKGTGKEKSQCLENTTKPSTSKEIDSSVQHQQLQPENIGDSYSQDRKQPLTKPCSPNKKVKFPTYEKRKGTVDSGKEFEILMCALYALKFSTSDQVVDFEMTTNNKKCGDFDDIEIETTFNNNEKHKFLFQLKHKEQKETITEETLTKEYFQRNKKQEKNKLYLLNYLKSIKDNSPNVTYILYTNSKCGLEDGTELSFKSHDPLTVRKRADLKYGDLLINVSTTNKEKSAVFQFIPENATSSTKIDKLDEICDQFYLFANQDNVKCVKVNVEEYLKDWLTVDVYNTFEHFMNAWWSGNFILTKHDVIAKLTELSLSPYIRTVTGNKFNEKSGLLAQAIMGFDMTIVTNCDTVTNIWLVSEEKDDIEQAKKKFVINITEPTQIGKCKVLWYLGMVPLVVTVDDSNVAIVKKAMNLLRRDTQNTVHLKT